MNCTSFTEDGCGNAKCASYRKRLTIKDIHKLFQVHDKCDTSIVYIDSHQNGSVISELCVKQISHDCNVFFTRYNDYYYFYNSLMHRLILWSRHPRALGKEGIVGHHTTIGYKNGKFDVHTTEYDHMDATVGTYKIISPNVKRTFYKLDPDLFLPDDAPNHLMFLWDSMWCKEFVKHGGAKDLQRLLKTTPQKQRSFDIDKIKKRMAKIKTHGFLRLPYVPKDRMTRIARQLYEGFDGELQIVSHHPSKSTLVGLCLKTIAQTV